ncbi:TPA: hypothetical protein EYO12_02265 [Candidatus Saccharibacteria bacterium]|nr:hypothetical protein [Candidatus Saccharibacteria bacterium]HIO87672.1 hypothetical protein [Candidatus Saccharibacteria bacterium]
MLWLIGAGIALAISLIVGMLDSVLGDNDHPEWHVPGFFVNWLIVGGILYWLNPPLTGILGGLWWLMFPLIVVAAISFGGSYHDYGSNDSNPGGYLAAGLVVLIMIWGGLAAVNHPWTQEGADELVELIDVQNAEVDEYPATDPTHVVLVNADIATFKANQSMASGPQVAGRNLETVLAPGEPVLQQVNGHLYWIVELQFTGFRTASQIDHTIPGYIVVDAEDPNAAVQFRDEFEMTFVPYTPQFLSSQRIERQLFTNGYATYNLDDLTIEVDDEWNPYYTLAISRPLHSGTGKGNRPVGFLVIDPQDGDVTRYDLDEVPEWVDRVYSSETVSELLGYWGAWANAPRQLIETPSNRFDVSGEPGLVYTQDGRAVWQVLMTSQNSDTSASSVILVDARTGEATKYTTSSGITIEENVIDVMRATDNNRQRHNPVNPQLYSIYGELSWVASFVPSTEEGNSNDSFAAVAIMPATRADTASVVYSTSYREALSEYRQVLASNFSSDDPNTEATSVAAEGTVEAIASSVVEGNTLYYIRLADDERTFIGPVGESLDLPFVAVGDEVRIRFFDVGSPFGEVDISSFDILVEASR